MTIRQILLLLPLASLLSCGNQEPATLTTIDILDGIKAEKEFLLSEIVDEVEYVKLETTPECLFSWATYLVGKKYIIVNQSYNPAQIFLFSRTGKFIRKIGGEGKGPLEYTSLSSVVADPEETYILVNDYQRDIIMKYDFDGQVISSYNYKDKLDGDVAGIVVKNTDEIYLRLDYPRLEKKDFYLIRKVDRDFNPIDSLYPITTTLTEGNGFSWGGSDFYLKDGAIQFRQFSFDTLYGEMKGKMVPRFAFPIQTNHLPGPYLVSGLHKQMYDYTSIFNVSEFQDYLILYTRIVQRPGGNLLYNKSSGELYQLKKYPPCPPDTISRRMFFNDIDGIVHPRNLYPSKNLWVNSYEIIDLMEFIENDCVDNPDIKFPAKRDELLRLVKESKEEDNPILQIFHVR